MAGRHCVAIDLHSAVDATVRRLRRPLSRLPGSSTKTDPMPLSNVRTQGEFTSRRVARRLSSKGIRMLVMLAVIVTVATAFAGCEDGVLGNESGFVHATINGLPDDAVTLGTVTISGDDLESVTVPLLGQSDGIIGVPVGTWNATYVPPAGFTMAPGSDNDVEVTVVDRDTTDVIFAVVEASGVLDVTVTGLADDATDGGTASILRTDVSGQTPAVLPIPATNGSGSATISLLAGSYDVSFSAPPEHDVAPASANPVNVNMAHGDRIDVAFAVVEDIEEVPPPPTGTRVVFHSDFGTATGRSQAALRDTDKPKPWDAVTGSGQMNEVVSTGHGLPSANALHVVGQPNSGLNGFSSDNIRVAGLPVPRVGESLYYRWYMAVTVPDRISSSPGGHPIQDGQTGAETNWSLNTLIYQNGTWQPDFGTAYGADIWPNNRWQAPVLQKNTVYRFELRIHRLADGFNMHARIFDADGTLLYDDDDFVNRDGSATLADEYVLPWHNVNNLSGFQIGTNGPRNNWGPLQQGVGVSYYYQGAIAICTGNWCGPYTGGI